MINLQLQSISLLKLLSTSNLFVGNCKNAKDYCTNLLSIQEWMEMAVYPNLRYQDVVYLPFIRKKLTKKINMENMESVKTIK